MRMYAYQLFNSNQVHACAEIDQMIVLRAILFQLSNLLDFQLAVVLLKFFRQKNYPRKMKYYVEHKTTENMDSMFNSAWRLLFLHRDNCSPGGKTRANFGSYEILLVLVLPTEIQLTLILNTNIVKYIINSGQNFNNFNSKHNQIHEILSAIEPTVTFHIVYGPK